MRYAKVIIYDNRKFLSRLDFVHAMDNDTFLKKLGARITEFRIKKGISQVELGLRCDIEKPNMNRIEKGNTNPTILTLKKICAELEVSIEELMKGIT
jgi:DNA-binding XRE family transcriptional regulator